jgi:transcriptional regulator
MYIPKHFEEPRVEVMHDLIRTYPFATLITRKADAVEANHIPLVLYSQPAPLGLLRGHVARANTLWQDHPAAVDVLAVFQGPQAYITPSWYATKAESGKVVPTWNYVAVHASGPMRVIQDPEWLLDHLAALTAQQEAAFARPWAVSDAPKDFTRKLVESIVGIEMTVAQMHGKWKVGQNRPQQDQASLMEGLLASGRSDMAEFLRSKGIQAG